MSKKGTNTRESIKRDLLKQLKTKCITERFYLDLIDDYMSMWDMKNLLNDDVKERGAIVQYDNGGGQTGSKKNESIAEYTRVNAQMLKLLSELGLKAVDKPKDDGGDFHDV